MKKILDSELAAYLITLREWRDFPQIVWYLKSFDKMSLIELVLKCLQVAIFANVQARFVFLPGLFIDKISFAPLQIVYISVLT